MNRAVFAFVRLARSARRFCRPLVTISPPPPGVRVDWNVPVVVRDGVILRVNIFRPATEDPVPVLMSVHPYGKDRIPAKGRGGKSLNIQYRLMPQPRPIRISAWTGWEAPDPAVWVQRGYAVVNADMRGSGTSGGTGRLFSDGEAQDYADLIDWAGSQPWSNGKVGLDGVSYLAISQYKVAALRPAHLAAICPWEGFTDLYRDFVYPGGVRETGFTILWSRITQRAARLEGNLARQLDAHRERDAFYDELTPNIPAITVPMLVCGSFSDHNLHTRGAFELFRRAASPQKWLYTHRDGKWSHYYGAQATQTRAAFFDHYLRGVDNGWPQTPRVRLAVHEFGDQPATVHDEDMWPPTDLTWTTLYLTGTGLQDHPGTPATSSYSNKHGRLRYEWRVPADLDLVGPMSLRLYLSATGADDPSVFATVHKIHNETITRFQGSFGFDGDAVSSGWQRVAFRDLDPDLSAPYRPVHTFTSLTRLAPDEVVQVDVELREQATRFRAGDTLRLEIHGRWPKRRNPATGQFPSGYRSSTAGTCTIHTGQSHPSALLIGHRPARD